MMRLALKTSHPVRQTHGYTFNECPTCVFVTSVTFGLKAKADAASGTEEEQLANIEREALLKSTSAMSGLRVLLLQPAARTPALAPTTVWHTGQSPGVPEGRCLGS